MNVWFALAFFLFGVCSHIFISRILGHISILKMVKQINMRVLSLAAISTEHIQTLQEENKTFDKVKMDKWKEMLIMSIKESYPKYLSDEACKYNNWKEATEWLYLEIIEQMKNLKNKK